MNIKSILFTIILLTATALSAAAKEDNGLGVDGIKGAVMPPPGLSYRLDTSYMWSDKNMDKKGHDDGSDFNLSVVASVHSITYVTQKKILGADYGWRIVMPIVRTDLEINDAVDATNCNIGDITLIPVMLGWHKERFDVFARMGFLLPTGTYGGPADPGGNHWSLLPTVGLNYYITKNRKLHVSALLHYEYHFKNQNSPLRMGDDISVEYGLGFSPLNGLDVGASGYMSWHVGKDENNPEPTSYSSVYSMGPEIKYFIEKTKTVLIAKYFHEFAVKGRSEGQTVWLAIIQNF